MKLCKITGKCWSSVKEEQLKGLTFLLAQEIKPGGELKDEIIAAVDDLGAAEGDIVLISHGNAVSYSTFGNKPIDSLIIAIVERYTVKDI